MFIGNLIGCARAFLRSCRALRLWAHRSQFDELLMLIACPRIDVLRSSRLPELFDSGRPGPSRAQRRQERASSGVAAKSGL